MNSIYKKYIKICSFVIGGLFLLLVITTWCISQFFKDKLIQFAIKQINEQVDAKITVNKSDFAFWKTFPSFSVEFDNVVVFSLVKSDVTKGTKKYNSDTLLRADKVYFEFNLIKLLNKNYVLKKIQINDGNIILVTYQNGRSNFDILRKKESTSVSPEITLKSIALKNCSIRYIHENSSLDIKAFTKKTLVKGEIKDRMIDFSIESDLDMESLNLKARNYLSHKELIINTQITILDNSIYTFKNSEFTLSDVPFCFHGTYSTKPENFLRLFIDGENLGLGDVISLLPASYTQKLARYKIKGKCGFQFSIDGVTGNSSLPPMVIKFQVSKGSMEENISKIALSGLEVNAIYSNGSDNKGQLSYLKINKFNSKIGWGTFSIHGLLEDLAKPKVNLDIFTQLNINDLKNFLHLDTFEILDGSIESNFVVTGSPGRFDELGFSDTKNLKYKGQVEIKNASVKLKNKAYRVHNINGIIKLDDDIYFNDLSLYLHDNRILINGKMLNGLPYLFRLTNSTTIEADVSSNNIDLSNFFVKGDSQPTGSYSRALLFPDNIIFDLKLNVNDFKLNKFNAKWLKCNLFYKPGMFVIKSASFETCEGRVTGNGAIMQDIHKSFIVKGQLDVSKINIRQMFHTFNDFDQKIIKEEHLKGKLSGKINFSSVWNNELAFLPEMLTVESDVTIYNGELVNFKPLLGLSKFIAVEELKNIKFSTLHDNIFIKDKRIIIPQMDIQSSAFNISGSGVQNFDGRYNYKIRILLSDILYGKAKRAKKENEEFGRVEDDGLGKTSLYLNIEGNGNIYKISYDSRKTMDVVKESLTKQKRELKEIFKEEFGWFKKDTTLKRNSSATKSVLVEWEDSTARKPINKVNKPNKKKEKSDKMQVEWE